MKKFYLEVTPLFY